MLASNLSDVATVYAAEPETSSTAALTTEQPTDQLKDAQVDKQEESSGEVKDSVTSDSLKESADSESGSIESSKTDAPELKLENGDNSSKEEIKTGDNPEEKENSDITEGDGSKKESAQGTDPTKVPAEGAETETTKTSAQENTNDAGRHFVSLSFSFDSADGTTISADVDQSGLEGDNASVTVSDMVHSTISVDSDTYQYDGASLKKGDDTITDSLGQLSKSTSDGITTYQYKNTDNDSEWSDIPSDTEELTIVFHYKKETSTEETVKPTEKGKISFTVSLADEDGKAVSHPDYTVSSDFDTLSLTEQPVAIDGYTYKGAKVNDNAAKEIVKKTATDDDGNKTYTYTYDNGDSSKASTIDGTTAEITFVYATTEKKTVESIVPTVKCVDEDGKTIKDATDTLPAFENSLALGDTDKAPVTLKGYTYKNAKIGSTVISSLTKEEKEDKDTGAKTTVYSYTAGRFFGCNSH